MRRPIHRQDLRRNQVDKSVPAAIAVAAPHMVPPHAASVFVVRPWVKKSTPRENEDDADGRVEQRRATCSDSADETPK